jgi:hypothetical protein
LLDDSGKLDVGSPYLAENTGDVVARILLFFLYAKIAYTFFCLRRVEAMARFSRADDMRFWGTRARERLYKHYRGLSRKQRIRLRANLKEAREHVGLDQRKAAALLGQDQSFISKIESGKRQVEFVEVEHFAEIYKKPLSFFSTRVQNAAKHGKTKPKAIDRKKRRVR